MFNRGGVYIEARLEDRSLHMKEAGWREFHTEEMACAQRERHKVKSLADPRKLSKLRAVGAKGSQPGEVGQDTYDDHRLCKSQ